MFGACNLVHKKEYHSTWGYQLGTVQTFKELNKYCKLSEKIEQNNTFSSPKKSSKRSPMGATEQRITKAYNQAIQTLEFSLQKTNEVIEKIQKGTANTQDEKKSIICPPKEEFDTSKFGFFNIETEGMGEKTARSVEKRIQDHKDKFVSFNASYIEEIIKIEYKEGAPHPLKNTLTSLTKEYPKFKTEILDAINASEDLSEEIKKLVCKDLENCITDDGGAASTSP